MSKVVATPRREWTRRYPPLLAVVGALLLAILALPSALNLPQANPGQTLEYAPVPGSNGQAPPGGNLAGLGLANSGTVGGSGAGGAQTPPSQPGALNGIGNVPSQYACVGNPPRQTEDPLSPPCVAYYDGNNGGATHTGVTATSITVLFYVDCCFQFSNCNSQAPPQAQYYDLGASPAASENTCVTRDLRGWETYFNSRFQTYKRVAHFWVYIGVKPESPSQRRADAADNISRVHPFAVVMPPATFDQFGYMDSYQTAMNQAGVLVFTSNQYQPNSFYQQYAGLLWGYAPSLEEQARTFAGFVCTRVKPYRVSFSSDPSYLHAPRTYGLVETTDPSAPQLQAYQDMAKRDMEQCGITFSDTATYPIDGVVSYTGPQQEQYQTYAAPAMARFGKERLTTVIWPGGFENQFSQAADKEQYFPEWITEGDSTSDGFNAALTQDQSEWADAWVVTTNPRIANSQGDSDACDQAYRSVVTNPPETTYACFFYPAILQLFTGIQVAGPRLTPQTMDEGYHAIPPRPSPDPEVPACFYDAGDYTCVKDATAEWWDPHMPNPYGDSTAGCWRQPDQGERYLANQWPSSDVTSRKNPAADPCNGFGGNFNVRVTRS